MWRDGWEFVVVVVVVEGGVGWMGRGFASGDVGLEVVAGDSCEVGRGSCSCEAISRLSIARG